MKSTETLIEADGFAIDGEGFAINGGGSGC